jgi:hypothetical protein
MQVEGKLKNIGTNVKKRDWYHFKNCGHAENHKSLASHSHGSVATQLANGMTKLKKGCLICHSLKFVATRLSHVEYEAIKPLYEFLAMPKKWQEALE